MNFRISNLILTLFLALTAPQSIWSQSQDVRDTDQLLRRYEKEGQLFTIKIVPKGKNIDIFLTGYKTAGVKFTDVGLEAYAQIGNRKLNLNVTKDNNTNRFQVTRHTTVPFTLDLNLKQNEKTDKFRFDVP